MIMKPTNPYFLCEFDTCDKGLLLFHVVCFLKLKTDLQRGLHSYRALEKDSHSRRLRIRGTIYVHILF